MLRVSDERQAQADSLPALVPAGPGLGFSDVDRVGFAAALVPRHDGPSWRHGSIAPELSYWLRVAPGVVGLRSGRPTLAERLVAELPEVRKFDGTTGSGSSVELERDVPLPMDFPPLDAEAVARWEAAGFEGRMVRGWSARSRARMVRTLAEIDYGPLDRGGCRRGMVTLTYPGDWLSCAPDAATVKRHLGALRRRFSRAFGFSLVGTWKLEFQRRGAPHLHLFVPVPLGILSWQAGKGRASTRATGTFVDWLSQAWYEVVGSGDERHLRAGTGVDFGIADRCSDPKRLSIYFSKHGHKGGAKGYQNECPAEWSGGVTGRFWGVWGLPKIVREAQIDQRDAVEVRRLLRGVVKAQRRTVTATRYHVDYLTGEVRSRRQTRRYRLRSLCSGSVSGGFVISNDGPALAESIARHLSSYRS